MRYRVLDLPIQGAGAFTPAPTTNPTASSWGLVQVTALLGRVPISTGDSKAVAPTYGDPGYAHLQGSDNSPDILLRDQYVAYADNMGPSQHFGMALRRFTPMPVPAVGWIASARKAMVGRKVGGRTQAAMPRAFQRWPNRAG